MLSVLVPRLVSCLILLASVSKSLMLSVAPTAGDTVPPLSVIVGAVPGEECRDM